ncbi:hypothetical protein ACHAWF_002390, partial [Thalassiosira exigua]
MSAGDVDEDYGNARGEDEGEGDVEVVREDSEGSEVKEGDGFWTDPGVRAGGSSTWKTYDLASDCATSDYPRLIHGRDTWEFLQKAYLHSGGRFRFRPEEWQKRVYNDHAFEIEFEVRDDGHRGRSIYAAEDIPEDTLVYESFNLAGFRNAYSLDNFLRLLPHDLQCEVFLWAYPAKDGWAWVDLDEGAFINHGEIKQHRNLNEDCWTTREVAAGEELLENYHQFGWGSAWFLEARKRAWTEAKRGGNPIEQYNEIGAPKSSRWRTYDRATDCATSNYPRLMHGSETWEFLQKAYLHSGGHFRYRPPSWKEKVGPPGFQIEFEVRDDGHRGRSIYAAQPVPEDVLVYQSYNLAGFQSLYRLYAFLRLLPHDLQCEVFLWAYPAKGGWVWVALDEGSYMNHGETEELRNLDKDCWTTRDVAVKEELLQDYGAYADYGRESAWFMEARNQAWRDVDAGANSTHVGEDALAQYNKIGAPKPSLSKGINPHLYVTFAALAR